MFPEEIYLEPTNFCNFKCIMCPHGYEGMVKNKGFMDYELFKKIIDDCRQYPGIILALHNMGESLLHPQIADMCTYASKAGLKTMLHTNGSLLTPELSKRLVGSGLKKLSFSFEGEDALTYEKIRVNGIYKNVLDNILTFLEINQGKVTVTIQILRFNMNDSLEPDAAFKELFKKYKVNFYIYKTGSWKGDVKTHSAYRLAKKRFSPIVCPYYQRKMITIGWDGIVRGCCLDYNTENPLGDLKKSSVQDVWGGILRRTLGEKIAALQYDEIHLCRHCDAPYQIQEDDTNKYFEKAGVVKIGYRPALIE
ncbi:MAG: radical SAM protein [Candidatus Omnitrophica bacterium]|nr:radical SAM protein [Candidatus Omnitrophota bacterium]